MTTRGFVAFVVLLALRASPLFAQVLPSTPLVIGNGRLVIGGEVTATYGTDDEGAWFNVNGYYHNALRFFRAGLTGELRVVNDRLSLLSEVRLENLDQFDVYAAYVRWNPWKSYPVTMQAGRIPPTFGRFSRRAYASDNPVIGYPLAYQYLMSIRTDAIPATTDDLLRMRARGWLSTFPIGSTVPDAGVAIASAYSWDTGVQVRVGPDAANVTASITNGSLSVPTVRDNNKGKQFAARVQVQPTIGLLLGASVARAAWLDQSITDAYSPDSTPLQRAFGGDAEYSRGYWVVRGEFIIADWRIPPVHEPRITDPVVARAGWIESRYRLTPRIFAAGRADRLTFSKVTGTLFGGAPTTWEAPVTRVELGGGYYLQRNLIAKAVWQGNWRDGGRVEHRNYVSVQLLYWF